MFLWTVRSWQENCPVRTCAVWNYFFLLSPPFLSPSVCGFPKSKMKMKGFLFWEVVIIFFFNMWCWALLHRLAFRDFRWQCAGPCCRDAGFTLAMTHFILFIFSFKIDFSFIVLIRSHNIHTLRTLKSPCNQNWQFLEYYCIYYTKSHPNFVFLFKKPF